MLCNCYDLRYDMIWYVHDIDCYVWRQANVMIWYMLTEWNDWHSKRQTSMKYNPDLYMRIMINVMKNVMIKWYNMKEDDSGIVLNNNENEKRLETHALLCVYALGDSPIPWR